MPLSFRELRTGELHPRKLACEYGSQGAVLGVGEADLAPPSPTLLLTKHALTMLNL